MIEARKFKKQTTQRCAIMGRMSARIQVNAIVASTHPLEKYDGRFRLTHEDLDVFAERYRSGAVQFNFSHDPLRSSDSEVRSATVEPTDEGEWRLRIEFDVAEDDWLAYQAQCAALGVETSGMSYSRTIDFAVVGSDHPTIVIAGDAAAFTQDEILIAVKALPPGTSAGAAEYVEFGLIDELINVLVIAQQDHQVQNFEWAVFSAMLWPALQGLRKVGKRIRYRFQVRRTNGSVVDVVAEADGTEGETKRIVERLAELEDRVSALDSEVWELKNDKWWKRRRRG